MPDQLLAVSAPGKSILIGEHAAVYGRPALVAAIDRRLRVTLEPSAGPPGVDLDLEHLGVREHVAWSALEEYAATCCSRWRAFAGGDGASSDAVSSDAVSSDAVSFDAVRGDDPAHVVKVALGEASSAAPRSGDGEAVRLRVESTLPIGAGFGSSAAAAVALVRAVLALRDAPATPERLHRLALEVERRQHGTPSGVDDSTVIHGGVVWVERRAGELARELTVEPLDVARSPLLERLRVADTGRPEQETGAVVAAVRTLRTRDPAAFDARLDTMAAATHALRRQLVASRPDDAAALEALRTFQRCLEELGVVPPSVRALVRQVERAGGAAKISGAGALAGSGAGSLLVYHPEAGALDRSGILDRVELLDLRFGAPGVRVEASPRRIHLP
ncbi:MAG: mevalonate kinase [Acidobacteriota bacterium]